MAAAVAVALLGWYTAGAVTDNGARARVTDRTELQLLFVDQTFYGRYGDGSNFVEYYAPDGRAGYWDGCPHAGRWRIETAADGAVACFVYPTMAPPGPHCFDVFRAKGRLEFLLHGSDPTWPAHAWTRQVRPGNPEQLSLTASGCQISSRHPDDAKSKTGRG
jgi:hypothetical protein